MPKVSILLTTYNRPKMLKKALDSIFSQTCQDYEIILLDDNSNNSEQLELLKWCKNCEYKDKIISIVSDVKFDDRIKKTRYKIRRHYRER